MAPRTTANEWTLWVVAVACALHVAEEFFTGWQAWADDALGISISTAPFLVMNAILVAVAFLLARVGWRQPAASLVIPGATLVNAVFFHILPTLIQGRRSPGVYTAALLYVPFSSWAFVGALRDGVPKRDVLIGLLSGTAMMIAVVLGARWLGRANGTF